MTTRPDPLDDILREAHRRGQVVLMHPTMGPVFVGALVEERVTMAPASLEAIDRLDQMTPVRPAKGTRS